MRGCAGASRTQGIRHALHKEVSGQHLAILDGKPRTYRAYAEGYFEADVPLAAIEHVYAGKPIDQKLIDSINPERTLADLKADLVEIGYRK